MTDEQKRLYMEAMAVTHQAVLNIVCPPGAIWLLALTWIIAPPALIWLYWVAGWFG